MSPKKEKVNANNEEFNEEEYFARVHPFCDGCHDEFYMVNLIECPDGYAGEHGEFHHFAFCEDCCKSNFEWGQCREDVEECERAAKMLSELLKKYAEENNLKTIESIPHVYFNEAKTYCIGEWTRPPSKMFNDKLVHFDSSKKLTFYEGTDSLLVKGMRQNLSFDIEDVREIKRAFRDLYCDFWGYSILKNKRGLILSAAGVWAALAPRFDELDYELEKTHFMVMVREGYNFFEITKKDGLVLVDVEEMDFDWAQLRDQEFVELCYDIIKTLPRIESVQITEGTGDLGQDIRAIEIVETLLGEEKKIWTIQCKHFLNRKVNPCDIQNIPNAYPKLEYNVFCLMTSGFVSPRCQGLLESWEKMPNIPIKTVFWDKKKIEDYLRNKPDIYARYFIKKKN